MYFHKKSNGVAKAKKKDRCAKVTAAAEKGGCLDCWYVGTFTKSAIYMLLFLSPAGKYEATDTVRAAETRTASCISCPTGLLKSRIFKMIALHF